jgi:hypothetical protein
LIVGDLGRRLTSDHQTQKRDWDRPPHQDRSFHRRSFIFLSYVDISITRSFKEDNRKPVCGQAAIQKVYIGEKCLSFFANYESEGILVFSALGG